MSKKSRKNSIIATGVIAGIVLFAPVLPANASSTSQPTIDNANRTAALSKNTNKQQKFTTKRDTKTSKSFYIDGEFVDFTTLLKDSITEAYSEYSEYFDEDFLENDPLSNSWKNFDLIEDPYQEIYPDEYLNYSTK